MSFLRACRASAVKNTTARCARAPRSTINPQPSSSNGQSSPVKPSQAFEFSCDEQRLAGPGDTSLDEPDAPLAVSASGAHNPSFMSLRLRVLLSAYACEPHKGSGPEVGWQWALQMARFHDVTVLTQSKNRPVIERALEP